MSVNPEAVVEQDDFFEEFELRLEDDLLINTQLADYISLDGDFEGLMCFRGVYFDNTTVTVKIYGDLKYDTGTGHYHLIRRCIRRWQRCHCLCNCGARGDHLPMVKTTRAEAVVFLYRIYNNPPLYRWHDKWLDITD
jgi:hypothetical protein